MLWSRLEHAVIILKSDHLHVPLIENFTHLFKKYVFVENLCSLRAHILLREGRHSKQKLEKSVVNTRKETFSREGGSRRGMGRREEE